MVLAHRGFSMGLLAGKGHVKIVIQLTRKAQNKFIRIMKPLRIVIYSVQSFEQFFNSALAHFYDTEIILHKKCEQRHRT